MEKAREVLRTLCEVEQEVPTRDGSAWFTLRIQPYRTIENSIAGVVITFVDVTAQKRTESELQQALAEAEQGRRLLDAVMENVPEGITIADAPDVRIRMVSRYGRELTGKARHLLEGITVEEHAQRWQIYAADQTTLADNEDLPLTRATKHGEVIRNEEWVLGHSDGTRVPVLCNAGPIRDEAGAIVGGVIAWRDITERKRGEEALRLANEQLEEVNRRKNHFLAVLSHELRNPLAPIKNSLHILDQAVLERVAATAPPRRVLIIEDNPDAADSLRAVLELAEHEVAIAYNGPEGIAKARAFRGDALLEEVHLVALSGYALPEDLKRAAEAGFEQHLAKPPDLDALTEVLAGPPAR